MLEPSLFAGTWAQYSKKARPQENSMTRMSGQDVEIFISWSFRCPYQAKVIKMFDTIRSSIVQMPCILKNSIMILSILILISLLRKDR